MQEYGTDKVCTVTVGYRLSYSRDRDGRRIALIGTQKVRVEEEVKLPGMCQCAQTKAWTSRLESGY